MCSITFRDWLYRVTRNVRDFKMAEIPVFGSDEIVKILY